MALYARKSRSGNWDNVTDQSPEDVTFPADVIADILDGENEVSVWEIEDPPGPEMDHIIAALHSQGAQNLSDVTFRIISDWRIKEQLKLKMHKTPGISLDSILNKAGKHWVIEINSVGDAIRLAKAFKSQQSHPFSRAEVMRRFAASVQANRISTEKVSSGLWKKLLEEGWLQVSVPEKRSGSPGDKPADVAP